MPPEPADRDNAQQDDDTHDAKFDDFEGDDDNDDEACVIELGFTAPRVGRGGWRVLPYAHRVRVRCAPIAVALEESFMLRVLALAVATYAAILGAPRSEHAVPHDSAPHTDESEESTASARAAVTTKLPWEVVLAELSSLVRPRVYLEDVDVGALSVHLSLRT